MSDTKNLTLAEFRNLFSNELSQIAKTLKQLNNALSYLDKGEGFNVKAWINSYGYVCDITIEFPAYTNFAYPNSADLFKELRNKVNCLIAKIR